MALKGVPVQEPSRPKAWSTSAASGTTTSTRTARASAASAWRTGAPPTHRPRTRRKSILDLFSAERRAERSGQPGLRALRLPGRQALEELAAVARVAPGAVDELVVEAAGARRQPHLVQRRLGVDDDLAAVGKAQFEQARRCAACRCRPRRPAASGRPWPRCGRARPRLTSGTRRRSGAWGRRALMVDRIPHAAVQDQCSGATIVPDARSGSACGRRASCWRRCCRPAARRAR